MMIRLFNTITAISRAMTLTATVLSIVGIVYTGFYPAIVVFVLLTFITLASKFYSKKIAHKSEAFQKRYHVLLISLNMLIILVVLMMIFVIVHDRVLHDE